MSGPTRSRKHRIALFRAPSGAGSGDTSHLIPWRAFQAHEEHGHMFEQTFKNIDDRPKQYEWFQSTLHKLADAIPPFVGGLDADPATQSSEHKGPSS